MPASPVKIGPFSGGLNTYSEPTAVGDNEVVDIQNFDIDLDGSLYSRAPFIRKVIAAGIPGTGQIYLLGWFIWTDGVPYLITYLAGTGIYARNEDTGAWTTISTTVYGYSVWQYANKLWVVSNSSAPAVSWDPVAGPVAVPAIPKGTTSVIYKERLFVAGTGANSNRVYFSDAANFTTFQTTVNFFDVRAGDGQNIVKLVVYQDTIVVFKEDSTYAYSYDSSPTRGAVRVINATIGATNRFCVVEHENNLYVHHIDTVYQFSNWTFTTINMKVPLIAADKWTTVDTTSTLSILSDRLLVHHTDNIYVFNLKNATWTKWEITGISFNFNNFIKVPQRNVLADDRYYGGSRNIAQDTYRAIYEWTPNYPAGIFEGMTCYVVTKTYDFNVAYTFKRLFWWGVDILAKTDLTYRVSPVQYTVGVTHAAMKTKTHAQLNVGTHIQPFSVSIDVTDSMVIGNTAGNRMFIKLLKSLRFRQIYFTITGTNNGSLSQAPMRIYSILSFVDSKEQVSKQVS